MTHDDTGNDTLQKPRAQAVVPRSLGFALKVRSEIPSPLNSTTPGGRRYRGCWCSAHRFMHVQEGSTPITAHLAPTPSFGQVLAPHGAGEGVRIQAASAVVKHTQNDRQGLWACADTFGQC